MPDDPVAAAARRTRAAGTARLWTATFLVDLEPEKQRLRRWPILRQAFDRPLFEQHGAADLVARRARVRWGVGVVDAVGEEIVRRWPWLQGEDDDEDEDGGSGSESLVVGARYATPYRPDLGPGNPQLYPAWILDGLTASRRSRELGRDVVGDAPTTRHGFRADLREADVEHLERRWMPIASGSAWVDHTGLIRRVVWATGRPMRARLRKKDGEMWSVLELWDFGMPDVPHELPSEAPPPDSLSLPSTIRALAAERRAWKRAHPS